MGSRARKMHKLKLYLNKVLDVLDYQKQVNEKRREWGMKGMVEGLLRDARKEMEEGAIYGELGDRFQRRMDDAMRKTISLVKKAECGVVGHPTVESKVRSRRKEPFFWHWPRRS